MKILHTADLHIGKKLHEHSLLPDQRHILRQIRKIAVEEQAAAVVIAGDVYDRQVPSTEAVSLLDEFLTGLVEEGIQVLMVSGNHDSPERLSFGESLLSAKGLHIAGNYTGFLKTVVLEDEYGPVHFVLMPFVKPAAVGAPDLAGAVEAMLSAQPMTLSLRQRYVLVTHYFVTGEAGEQPRLSDSESDVNVGGLDNVPASYFANYCYVALGHIHRPQRIGQGNVYYAGSPLKYSFSEALGDKSVNLVELGEPGVWESRAGQDLPGGVSVRRIPLKPLHEMRCVKGKLADLISPQVLAALPSPEAKEDYLQVTLTDTEELIDPMSTLRSVYPNVLQIVMEKNLAAQDTEHVKRLQMERKETEELFSEFYEMLKGEPLDENRRAIVKRAAEEAK